MDKKYQQYAPLVLRLIMGYGFMAHGWVKLSRGPIGLEKLLTQINVPMPHLNALLLPFVELIGGLAIFVGAFTTVASIPLILTMLVAIITVNYKFGFSSVNTIGLTPPGPKFGPPGYEINLLYIAGLLSLTLSGAGRLSVDAWLKQRRDP
ncbi:DoxX family protein [Mucilaginibacter panaciglaebae]|uniref:DoxX family protein n=1 Tax=Mucilaginibacter panaciglaebae TaxID=502331 RepID=A0ABP7WRD7_9SPHI